MVCLILIMFMLSACGREETSVTPQYSNPTLKDINSVDLSEFTEKENELQTDSLNKSWSPKGNYTYVLPNAARGYQTAMIRVDSVDFASSKAYVSYVLGAADGTTENSNGILECDMNTIDHDNGTREIFISIYDNMSLEFKGTSESRTATFCFDGIKYTMKKEG